MEIKNVLVTGEACFLDRHQFLFKSLSNHFEHLNFLPRPIEWYEAKLPRTVLKGLLTLRTGDRCIETLWLSPQKKDRELMVIAMCQQLWHQQTIRCSICQR